MDTVGRWTTALENDAPLSRLSVSHKAELRLDGTVSDEISVRAQGASAQEHFEHQKNWPAKWLRQDQQNYFAGISPISRVESASWSKCDVTGCGWDTKVEFPHEASADGTRWLVPTTLLRRLWEGYFESPERNSDVHFQDTYSFEEVFDLKVPQGLELVSVPPPVKHQLKGLRVDLTFEKTAQGARVQRKVRSEVGVVSKKDYAELRSAIEAFRRGRREVLVFAPKP